MAWLGLYDYHDHKSYRYYFESYTKARSKAVELMELGSKQDYFKIYATRTGKSEKEIVSKYGGQYQVWVKGSKYGSYPIYKNGKIMR